VVAVWRVACGWLLAGSTGSCCLLAAWCLLLGLGSRPPSSVLAFMGALAPRPTKRRRRRRRTSRIVVVEESRTNVGLADTGDGDGAAATAATATAASQAQQQEQNDATSGGIAPVAVGMARCREIGRRGGCVSPSSSEYVLWREPLASRWEQPLGMYGSVVYRLVPASTPPAPLQKSCRVTAPEGIDRCAGLRLDACHVDGCNMVFEAQYQPPAEGEAPRDPGPATTTANAAAAAKSPGPIARRRGGWVPAVLRCCRRGRRLSPHWGGGAGLEGAATDDERPREKNEEGAQHWELRLRAPPPAWPAASTSGAMHSDDGSAAEAIEIVLLGRATDEVGSNGDEDDEDEDEDEDEDDEDYGGGTQSRGGGGGAFEAAETAPVVVGRQALEMLELARHDAGVQ
jgi:hypothetical protein